jgi:spermidine synthase
MIYLFIGLVYFIFFMSGVAALIYEVVWIRYLSLIFGGSHLAVTTVLAVFMGGLALGSYLIGKKSGSCDKLLRLYGFLELGIAVSALFFVALMHLYPLIYVPLAHVNQTSPLYLSVIRVTFAAIALILPTTLMGGTLPVLSGFISGHTRRLGSRLSLLYGFNTLGAVAGAALTGFFLLNNFSVSTTLATAVVINFVIGILGIILQDKVQSVLNDEGDATTDVDAPDTAAPEGTANLFSLKLVLWGIGVSGFCALGYEVLWTRVLSIVIGASVYGFTLLLMAFLAGIGLGSAAYGLFLNMSGTERSGAESVTSKSVVSFGFVQVIIGVSALFATMHLRDLTLHTGSVLAYFKSLGIRTGPFTSQLLANFVLAFSFMFVPAFYMGIAFPLAGKIHGHYRKIVGSAVGEILTYNTIGAILGSAFSGFALIYLLGIQRSVEVIILINIGFGLLVMASVKRIAAVNWGISATTVLAVLTVALVPDIWQLWDPNLYAIYQTSTPGDFSSREKIREALSNTDVLYYGEGVSSSVSVVRSGQDMGFMRFITNGRIEASNNASDAQCQYSLGHIPMLLNKDPKKVFVLGLGSGMTLGATLAHPGVEQVTLAEIEPKVLGVARCFEDYNHHALDNPKLKIVFNDGRNFLLTTEERFDVITADPIHPWFSGVGYLYSDEYFNLAAKRLNPGGIACQWLPLYELSEENLKSIVRTFQKNFAYTMIWLNNIDAELIGSNSPIVIDEQELERRIGAPEVKKDLELVKMGSARDFLSYFLMGTKGAESYSSKAMINTDDNLYLEFSAPKNIGKVSLLAINVLNISKYRESILPYLRAPMDETARSRQQKTWNDNLKAAYLYDKAHVMNVGGLNERPEYVRSLAELDAQYPSFSPLAFLKAIKPR